MIWSFHNASDILQVLGFAAAKAAGVLVAAMLLTACMRRASAAARHLVWTLALAVGLLLPIAGAITPSWKLAVLPPSKPAPSMSVKPPVQTVAIASAPPETHATVDAAPSASLPLIYNQPPMNRQAASVQISSPPAPLQVAKTKTIQRRNPRRSR